MSNFAVFLPVASIAAYLFGAVPWAFIIGKLNGIDIRKHGSGNPGATNVTRVLGKGWGTLCFILDFLKGALPVLAVHLVASKSALQDFSDILAVSVALSAVLGHVWTIFLGFRGGKGVATSAGALLALSPLATLLAALSWIIVFYTTRYVSLASMIAALALPIISVAISSLGIEKTSTTLLGLFVVLAALNIYRHRSNIRNLMNGTENRFSKSKNGGGDEQ